MENDKLKFTVLISLYYKESSEYLRKSLDSVFLQSLPSDEVVLVEDGPLTSELYEVVEEFVHGHPEMKRVVLEKNRGLGEALNEGLKHCSHDLVARMDTDDIAKPDRFEKQIKIFEKYPDIDVCSSWIEEFEGNMNTITAIKKLPEYHYDILKYAKHRCPINHPVVMYRKEAVIKVGGYAGFPEDYCLWVKMLLDGALFYNIQESLLLFRFSHDMIKRRGGWRYAVADIKSQISFYQLGFINVFTLFYNIIIRLIMRIIPNFIRSVIYKKLLRK
jgi:glycosyltransferase involved in cell wall biosynthesis